MLKLTMRQAEAISIAMAEIEMRDGTTDEVRRMRAYLNRHGF